MDHTTDATALVTLDLPAPEQMRGRWAAVAAVVAARDWSDGCNAQPGLWHYDDGSGNWADLHFVGDGRAVLLGTDHECTQTFYGPAAEEYGEEETDLLAGAPDWWARPVRTAIAQPDPWVGFAYGFDGVAWRRAPYEEADGFEELDLPAVTDDRCREVITELAGRAPGLAGAAPSPAAIDALIAADAAVTPELLRGVIGPTGWDAEAGAAAARAFRTG